ncbi:MAG: elongation factor G, partial [Hyphomicrobiales bacterium]|nr:elongation factor G [Hyphomicrobiales bacterium]
MSVEVNVAECEFLGENFTFIDCPGSVEFLNETQGVLPGIDVAVVVCEADEKKLPALQVVMKALEEHSIPRILFLNKIDKADQRVRETLEVLQQASERPLVLRQIPIWENGIATGFIDLALERAFVYREHAASEVVDMAKADQERETEARFTMLEALADYDDALMEQLLEDIAPPRDQVFEDLVKEMREGLIVPVLIGSAEQAHGIMRLLKAIRHEAPDVTETAARLGVDETGEAIVQVMKTIQTTHAGKLSVARVLKGSVKEGDLLYGAGGAESKVSSLFKVMGQQATKRGVAGIGETVALGKADMAKTGDTLTSAKVGIDHLATLDTPQPVMAKAIIPTERKDEVKLSAAIAKIAEEDPSLVISHNQDTGETLLQGQGEMHLRVTIERLTGKYGIAIETREPHIPYKETIKGTTTVRGRHKKQSGGHGQFGDVVLDIKPLPRGSGFQFSDTITGGVVPKQYIPSVHHGIEEYLVAGPLGFPVVDIAVVLTDGSYHTVDSSDMAFKTAAQIGMREGMPQCKPVLLEPVLEVEIVCPSDATAKINAILSARRGQILGFDTRPGWEGWDVVKAMVPQAEVSDLIVELRSATAGVG